VTEARSAGSPPRLVVLSGPSGVGKGSVVRAARELAPQLWVSVSATTRPPRPGERDGVDYHFVSPDRFAEIAAAGELLEHATYAGHRYGTPAAPVRERLARGQTVVLEIDLQGAEQVRASAPEALLVFLAPPDLDELGRRLAGRGTEEPAARRARLAIAARELAAADRFDVVVVNDDVGSAAARLVALALTSPTGEA
jgi:guanylate kinase